MFKKTLASLVLATFLVGTTGCLSATRYRGGRGGASGAGIAAAAGMMVGIAAVLGMASYAINGQNNQTIQERDRLQAGLEHRKLGDGSAAIVTNNGYMTAGSSGNSQEFPPAGKVRLPTQHKE